MGPTANKYYVSTQAALVEAIQNYAQAGDIIILGGDLAADTTGYYLRMAERLNPSLCRGLSFESGVETDDCTVVMPPEIASVPKKPLHFHSLEDLAPYVTGLVFGIEKSSADREAKCRTYISQLSTVFHIAADKIETNRFDNSWFEPHHPGRVERIDITIPHGMLAAHLEDALVALTDHFANARVRLFAEGEDRSFAEFPNWQAMHQYWSLSGHRLANLYGHSPYLVSHEEYSPDFVSLNDVEIARIVFEKMRNLEQSKFSELRLTNS